MSAATASASILMRRELFSVLQQQQRRWTTTASQGWCGCSSVSSSSSSSTATCQEQSSSLIRRRRRTMPSQNVGYTPDLDHSVIFPVSGSRPLSSWTSTFHGRRRRRSDVPQAKSWPSQPKPVASAPNEEPDPNHGTPPDDSTTINTILHTTATDNAVPLSSSTTTTPTASSSSSTQSLSSAASRRQQRWIDQLQSPPNLLTLSRIAATPLLCYWVITHQTHYAIVGCCLAAASDAADGLLARHGNMTTTLGTYLDPLGM